MNVNESKWYLRTQDETFGPETESKLVEWAKLGRIQPGQEVSDDEIVWRRVEDVPFLDMRFSIDIGDGNPRGPFNRAAAEALLASGRLPPTASMVEVRAPFEDDAAPGVPEDGVPEPDAPVRVEERIVEVPVEKIVEKVVEKEVIKEVRVEVPVEKIVEKIVVDETRVNELSGLLEEERRHTADLQHRMEEASKAASAAALAAAEELAKVRSESEDRAAEIRRLKAELAERDGTVSDLQSALKDAAGREEKLAEQVRALEDELRRLPQAASEVADIQAAMYGVMTGEADEISKLIEAEKREFEDVRARYQRHSDLLMEHRREILKRAGNSVEDMTRKALAGRPEDPRTVQLRKEMDELRRLHERLMAENERKVRDLAEQLRVSKAEGLRLSAGAKDMTQLRQETEQLREVLRRTEKELLDVRQRNEDLVKQQEFSQQALLKRLSSLESPSIGASDAMETNQSREAKMVKLPGWMNLKR